MGDNFALNQWIDPALPALAHLAEVDAFWLMPLLVLELAWSVLPGRRGTGRALAVWFRFALATCSAWLVPHVLDLAPPASRGCSSVCCPLRKSRAGM